MRHQPSAPLDDLFSLPPEVQQADMRSEPTMGPPRARATDPETSKAAAARAKAFAFTHADQVVGCLYKPRTAHEIASVTKLTVVQIDPRIHELVAEGRVRVLGYTRPAPETGVPCRVYDQVTE